MDEERMNVSRGDWIACAGLSAVWLLCIALVGPAGEFPIGDSWAYSLAVHGLLETGRFERDAFTWAPIVTNVGLGFVFVKAFGFSLEVLRWSSLLMGWLGILGAFSLCRQLGSSTSRAAAGALLYGLNPLHIVLSFTFLTDVAFAALCTWSLVFAARGLGTGGIGWFAAGAAAAVAAILSRQPGLAVPVAVAVAIAVRTRPSVRILLASGGMVAAGAAIFAVVPWLLYSEGDGGRMFTLASLGNILARPALFYSLVVNSIAAALYLGAFLAPLACLLLPSGRARWQVLAGSAVLAALLLASVARLDLGLPPGIDWVRDFGLGPIILAGAEHHAHGLPAALWWSILGLGGIAAGIVAVALVRAGVEAWPDAPSRSQRILLLVFPTVLIGVLATRTPFFDRYLVPALPPLIAILMTWPGKRIGSWQIGTIATCAIALGSFGILGARDNLEHHRARSFLLAELIAADVPPSAIDGGNEFGGWYTSKVRRGVFLDRGHRRWILDDEYIVSFEQTRAGYHAVSSRRYASHLGGHEEVLTTLHRDTPDAHAHSSPPGAGPRTLSAYVPPRRFGQ